MTTANDPFYEAITPIRDVVQALIDLLDPEPAPLPHIDSPAMRELALERDFDGAWGNEAVHHAHVIGSWKRLLAVDCAKAMIRDLYEDPPPVFAHKVLSRAVIENAAAAAWILEPAISIRQRIGRGRNERIFSAKEVLRLPDLPEAQRIRSNTIIETIRQTARELGFSVTANGWIEEDRPRFTRLLRWLLTNDLGGMIANYYSAVAHGTQYGLASAVLSAEPPTAFGERRVTIGTFPHDVRFALSASGLALIKGVSYEIELFGRDIPEWEQACTTVLNVVEEAMRQSKDELTGILNRDLS
ncbi:MAG: hypothetical protein WD895_05310 [Acidimicrobiia bacterium]